MVQRSLRHQSAAVAAAARSSVSDVSDVAGALATQGAGTQGGTLGSAQGGTQGATLPGIGSSLSGSVDSAVDKAMALESVPSSWKNSLNYIAAQESGGNVGVQNPHDSARGLFQLTAANYHHNPNGAGSFGNAVQEVQGGIRYIKERYGTADNAAQFWQDHHWY